MTLKELFERVVYNDEDELDWENDLDGSSFEDSEDTENDDSLLSD